MIAGGRGRNTNVVKLLAHLLQRPTASTAPSCTCLCPYPEFLIRACFFTLTASASGSSHVPPITLLLLLVCRSSQELCGHLLNAAAQSPTARYHHRRVSFLGHVAGDACSVQLALPL
jgi:hypothetical protein